MKINNKVLGIVTAFLMAGLVVAGGSIWTTAAQFYFNDTAIFLENVAVSNSLNSSLIFTHNDKNPQIEIESLDSSDTQGLLEFYSNHTKGKFTVQLMTNAGNPYSSLNVFPDDLKLFSFQFRNSTDSTYGGDALLYNNNKRILMLPNGDTDDYIAFTTVSNIPHMAGVGGEDIYFFDPSTSNWNTIHADAFTEHTQIYSGSPLEAKHDINALAEGLHPIRLAPESTKNKILSGDKILRNQYESPGTNIGVGLRAVAVYITYLESELCLKDSSFGFCNSSIEGPVIPPLNELIISEKDTNIGFGGG